MGKRLTPAEWIENAKATHGDKYDYSKVKYAGSSAKVEIVCAEHGSFWQLPAHHVYGGGCPNCVVRRGAPVKRLFSDFLKEAKKVHGDSYSYKSIPEYTPIPAIYIITAICKRHGIFTKQANEILRGWGCPACSKENKGRPAQDLTTQIKSMEKKWEIKVKYTPGKNSNVGYVCPVHGSRTAKSVTALLRTGCGRCSTEQAGVDKRYTHEMFTEISNTVHKNKYSYPEKYVRAKAKIKIECPKHGIFEQMPHYHMRGQGCPSCAASSKVSQIEKRVGAWIKKYTRIKRTRRVLDGKEIDIWCPDQKLGIEINGVYWHSEVFKPKSYHYDKAMLAADKGIKLLQFWEHELFAKAAVCKSMMRSSLGVTTRYYARELEIRVLKKQAAWFSKNHLQGGTPAEIAYGLFDGDTCLCGMSFGKPRFNNNYEWELVRFANALNTTVVGGASRLFSHFVRTHAPKSVISYADLRISVGNLYTQLNFKLSHTSSPNYFWCKGGRLLKRYQTQKHKLADVLGGNYRDNDSEVMNMHKNNWNRVYDAGNLVFVWSHDPKVCAAGTLFAVN